MFKPGIIQYSTGPSSGFILEWNVGATLALRTLTLPLVNTRNEGALVYNFVVDWGDGTPTSTVTAYNDPNRIHIYAVAGTYQTIITGICEGWRMNTVTIINNPNATKLTKIINWGSGALFAGFKYLEGGFRGCSNLNYIASGGISASGTGVLTDGFYSTFELCTSLTSIPEDLFKYHTSVTDMAFYSTFYACTHLASIPENLFKYNTLAAGYAFYLTFGANYLLTSIPANLFKYNTAVSYGGFYLTFYLCNTITSVPVDLFRYNTLTSFHSFRQCFGSCASLTTIPTDLFRYNTLVSEYGFAFTFYNCPLLASIPNDFFRYNTLVGDTGFYLTFGNCPSLTTVPMYLFRYNTAAITNAFNQTFTGCTNLQLNPWIFYASGEESTRFYNQSVEFPNCFSRSSFTGIQGTAPELWSCNFGTGVPSTSGCYGGAGNSLSSLSNYASIPAAWK